ncbi:Response regulator receiver, CheY-like [gamma proteobacterium HdN1]|nr:Response regulator receiver, CheY-like [gamma proteobacterium HdN1]
MPTILAVDDSPSMRHMVTYALRRGGFEVIEACDGVDALAKAQGADVDLILSDVNMPQMDGISLVRELRALPAYSNIPILMLTTEMSTERKTEGRNAGANGWIIKPFDPDRLLATIHKVLG